MKIREESDLRKRWSQTDVPRPMRLTNNNRPDLLKYVSVGMLGQLTNRTIPKPRDRLRKVRRHLSNLGLRTAPDERKGPRTNRTGQRLMNNDWPG